MITEPDDLEKYAFSSNAPWTIDPAHLKWMSGITELRARTQAELPTLLDRHRLPPLGRFMETVYRIGGAIVAWRFKDRPQGGAVSRAGLSKRLRQAAEPLGPAYIKLGQIISSGKGLFPDELVSEFKQLRDQVKPEPWESVQRTVEEDLGRKLGDVFSSFDRECLAAASIAQVHAATLRTGEAVVVKVQRPQVSTLVRKDIRAMAWIAPYLVGRIPISALANPPALVELFAETIVEELDFRLEAENMLDIAALLARTGHRIIIVPRPHPTLVTRRVLVMERLSGYTYDDVDSMHASGIDTKAMLTALVVSFLEGALLYGVFHGDLHGGNLFVTPEGKIALFDYGITARMDEKKRQAFLRLMMLGAVNDIRGQLEAYRDLGALGPDADFEKIIRDLRLDKPVIDPTTLTSEQLTKEIQHVTQALLGQGAKLPKPLMLFVKNLIFIDDATAHLAPDINLFDHVTEIYMHFAQNHAATIAAEIGMDPSQSDIDLTGYKAALGMSADADSLTHRELQKRRENIRGKLE